MSSSVIEKVNYKDIDLASGRDIYKTDTVRASVLNIVTTPKSALKGMIEFGLGVSLFEANNSITRNLIEREVTNEIEKWDERLTVSNSSVSQNENNLTLNLEIDVADGSTYNANVNIMDITK